MSEEVKNLTKKEMLEKISALTESLEQAEAKNEELIKESADFKDKWYRSVAEFENFKKRNLDARKSAYEDGKNETIKKILFVGDTVDRALTYNIDDNTKEGLTLLLRQYGEILTSLGLEEINPVGEPFDPNLHEAIFSKPCEEGQESGIVDSVFLKGYKSGDKIIRYAQVVVTQ